MLFYGLQGSPQVAGVRGLGDASSCLDTCDSTYDPSNGGAGYSDPGYASCNQGCANLYPDTSGGGTPSSTSTSNASSGSPSCVQNCINNYGVSSAQYNTCVNSCLGAGSGSSGSSSSGASQGGGTPWYAAIFGSVAQGVTSGLRTTGAPIPPTPWYASPSGMGIIAVALIGLAVFMAKRD
jgi:hypothetical protein